MKPIRAGNSARAFKRGRWRLPRGGGGVASVAVLLSGLSSSAQYSTFALVGDHASIGLTANGGAPDTLAWGSTPAGSEYGTGASPADFSAADTDDPNAPAFLYYSGTKDGEDFSGSVAIRAALPVNSVAPVIANDDPTGTDLGDTVTITAGTWSNAVSVVQNLFADAVLLDTGAAASHVITEAEDNQAITGEEVATSSGGVVTVPATGDFVVDDFAAAAMTDDLAISGTAEVGQTLSLTGGTVTGNPTPTVTYSWKRVSDDTELGTGSTLDISEAMHGQAIYAEKTADNTIGGGVTRTSAATAAVTYAAPSAGGALADQSFTENTGDQTFDPTSDFTVAGDGDLSGVTWSLPTTVAGVTINSSTGLITFDTDALAVQSSTAIVVRATNSGGFDDSGFSLDITAAAGVASISIDSIGPQASDGNVPVSYAIDQDDATVEAVLFLATEADPAAADFNGGGAPTYIDLGTVSLTTAGSSIPLSGPDGLQNNYKIALLPTGGGDVDVAVSASFALDSTDAVLSPTSATTGSGAGEVDWGFTPDEGGTYRVSLFADGAGPSEAAIEAGTGAVATTTGSGTASTPASGTLTGVASTAYDAYIYYLDAFGNETFVGPLDVKAGAAASGVAIANAAALAIDEGSNYQTSHSGAAAGFACDGGANNMVVAYCDISDGGGNIDTADLSATYDGQEMELLMVETGGSFHKVTAIFYLMNPPTTTGATIAIDYNGKTGRANTTIIEELSGVDAANPWGTPVSAHFGGAAMQIGITPSSTTGLIRCVAGATGANTSMTPTGDTTALYNAGTSPGGDNFNHHWTLVGAHDPADTSALTMGATDGESDASIIAAEALAA